jgi:hypothetical protein
MYCSKTRFSLRFDRQTICEKSNLLFPASLLLLLLLIPISTFGQKHYEEGFVVLNNKDTLYGSVKDRKPHPFAKLYKKIRFKGRKGVSKYGPNQILAYRKGGSTFESVWLRSSGYFFDQRFISEPNSGERHFLKVVEKGYLTYYQWEFEDADSGYIDAIELFRKENDNALVRVTQGLFGLKRKNLVSFFHDCPPLASMIQDKKVKYPIEIVRFYNTWKADTL